MFERIGTGVDLARQSFQVLKLDKELLVFPLLSSIACALVLATFLVPFWAIGFPSAENIQQQANWSQQIQFYGLAFLYYFVNYSVIIFFNSALVACAIIRFNGGDPVLSDGFVAAKSRLPQILGWALVAATVGMILKAIESKSDKVGQFMTSLVGTAWTAITYFVVPVIVVEKVGPIAAVKRSLSILKKNWGESLSANFGLGALTFVATLVAAIPAMLGFFALSSGQTVLGVIGIVIGVVLLLVVSLVSATLNAILVAALYLYAKDQRLPEQFDDRLFRDAFIAK